MIIEVFDKKMIVGEFDVVDASIHGILLSYPAANRFIQDFPNVFKVRISEDNTRQSIVELQPGYGYKIL